MTHQELFTTIVEHLFTQKRQSYKDGICRYRGALGAKCAVGVLMTDAQYDVALEGNATKDLPSVYQRIGMPLPDWLTPDNMDFLREMQYIHDELMPYADCTEEAFILSMLRSSAEACKHYATTHELTLPAIVDPYLQPLESEQLP